MRGGAALLATLLSLSLAGTASVAQSLPGEYIVRGRDGRHRLLVPPPSPAGLRGPSAFSGRAFGLPATEPAFDCRAFLKRHTGYEKCEPNQRVYALRTPDDPLFSSAVPGAPFDLGIGADRAWDISVGSHDVVVAVVDSGLDTSHPDIAPNVWVNPNEIPGNGVDDDGNGVVDDVNGFNAISGNGNVFDDFGHGTHLAGVIGAAGNNSMGVTGVNWNVRLLPIKMLNGEGDGTLLNALRGLEYLEDLIQKRGIRGIRVSNNSWGRGQPSSLLDEQVERLNRAGVLFVAAAGNQGRNTDRAGEFPANVNSANVVSVGALNVETGALAGFSNFGARTVDIAAPGVEVRSTYPNGTYGGLSGTSVSAPFVAGAAALLQSCNPELEASQLKRALIETVTVLPGLRGDVRTSGALDAAALLARCAVLVPLPERVTLSARNLRRGVSLRSVVRRGVHVLPGETLELLYKASRRRAASVTASRVSDSNGRASFKVRRAGIYRVRNPRTQALSRAYTFAPRR